MLVSERLEPGGGLGGGEVENEEGPHRGGRGDVRRVESGRTKEGEGTWWRAGVGQESERGRGRARSGWVTGGDDVFLGHEVHRS